MGWDAMTESTGFLRILIVEDFVTDAELAEWELRRGGIDFVSVRVETKDEFLSALSKYDPDLIISDYSLPLFNGRHALDLTLAHNPSLPLIILTGSINEETAVECMKAGAADYVIKEHIARLPFAVKGALERKQIQQARLTAERFLQQAHLELTMAYDATIEGWAHALDLRDKVTEGHSRRVMEMTLHMARELGLKQEDLHHVRRGALLHDIGKMGISDAILLKPSKLTAEEWEIMRLHPQLAYEMISPIDYLCPALDIPYCHHEKWDGSGYPRGLKGSEIPIAARIFAVVDVYDALTSDRPYRSAWDKKKALAYIREQSGRHFDPHAVDLFFKKT